MSARLSTDLGISTSSEIEPSLTALLSLLLFPILRRASDDLRPPSRLTFTSSRVQANIPAQENEAESISGDPRSSQTSRAMDKNGLGKLLTMFWAWELASRTSAFEVTIDFFDPETVSAISQRGGKRMSRTYTSVLKETPGEAAGLSLDTVVTKGFETPDECSRGAKIVNVFSFVHGLDGVETQRRLWEETIHLLRQYVPATQTDKLLDILE